MQHPNLCLKARIVESGLTHRALSQQLGLSELEVSRIVQGRKSPTAEVRQQIARTLSRDVAELFEEDSHK